MTRECTFPGCGGKFRAHGLCSTACAAAREPLNPAKAETPKRCATCDHHHIGGDVCNVDVGGLVEYRFCKCTGVDWVRNGGPKRRGAEPECLTCVAEGKTCVAGNGLEGHHMVYCEPVTGRCAFCHHLPPLNLNAEMQPMPWSPQQPSGTKP